MQMLCMERQESTTVKHTYSTCAEVITATESEHQQLCDKESLLHIKYVSMTQ